MPVIAFRAPIDVSRVETRASSRVRVGTTVGDPGGDTGVPTTTPNKLPPAEDSKVVQAAQKIGGYAFPVEVSVATVAGGAVGLFFGGWLWGLLGAAGSNLAGRFGASTYCKNTPSPTGYAAGKCGASGNVPK